MVGPSYMLTLSHPPIARMPWGPLLALAQRLQGEYISKAMFQEFITGTPWQPLLSD